LPMIGSVTFQTNKLRLGGYQVWTGFHSYVEKGTGETIVEKTVQMLSSLYSKVY